MRHGGILSFIFLSIFLFPTISDAATTDEVNRSLQELNQWLGEDENAQRWKSYLRSDELAAELAKGEAADRAKLATILEIYKRDVPGLQKSRFVAVRNALESWLAEAPVDLAQMPEAVRGASGSFRPTPPNEVTVARNQLQNAMYALDSFLAGGGAQKSAAWKEYLNWDQLQEELNKPDGPNPAQLQALAAPFSANHTGLERPVFSNVRDAILHYAEAAYFGSGERVQEAYNQQIEELAKRLEQYSKTPSTDDAAAIGRTLGWLERGGQVPHLVTSIRRNFDRPNLFARTSRRLVAAGVESNEATEKLNRPQAVTDYILKTSIHGTAYPNLGMSLQFVPNESQAIFELQLGGAATSSNVGYRGPVTVYTTGYTSISAAKRVYFDQNGFTSSGTAAACATSTNIYDIAANCGLIERLAWKQAGKSKGEAEAIASAHAQVRIARQVDSEVQPRLAEANESFNERFRNRLLRRDSFPRVFRASTTDDAMLITIVHATPRQVSAASDPPEIAGDHDLAVRMHESVVINFGETLLGGMTLTDERLVELLEESKSEVPEELQITPDKDPWSITFTQDQPVAAQFSGDEVRIAVRGRRFTRGDQEVRAVMEISATYKMEKAGIGSRLVRQGDVVADYVNRDRQSITQVAMKTFLRKKFEALFKPEIVSEGLQLPEQFQNIGKLEIKELKADNGWLSLGWQLLDETEKKVAVAAGG